MIFIKCMICEKEFRRITKTHLITHDIQNTAEYLKMFPGVEYIASDILEKESTRLKLNNPMHNAQNCKKVSDALTGKKLVQKTYFRHSGYPGGTTFTPAGQMLENKPERVIELAVRGMLPKNSLGRQMYRKLQVYRGAEHPHAAQLPEVLEINVR